MGRTRLAWRGVVLAAAASDMATRSRSSNVSSLAISAQAALIEALQWTAEAEAEVEAKAGAEAEAEAETEIRFALLG